MPFFIWHLKLSFKNNLGDKSSLFYQDLDRDQPIFPSHQEYFRGAFRLSVISLFKSIYEQQSPIEEIKTNAPGAMASLHLQHVKDKPFRDMTAMNTWHCSEITNGRTAKPEIDRLQSRPTSNNGPVFEDISMPRDETWTRMFTRLGTLGILVKEKGKTSSLRGIRK